MPALDDMSDSQVPVMLAARRPPQPATQVFLLGGSDDYPSVPPVEDFLMVVLTRSWVPDPARLAWQLSPIGGHEEMPPVPPVDDYMMIQTEETWDPEPLPIMLRATQDDFLVPPPPPPPSTDQYAWWESTVTGD